MSRSQITALRKRYPSGRIKREIADTKIQAGNTLKTVLVFSQLDPANANSYANYVLHAASDGDCPPNTRSYINEYFATFSPII